MVSHCEIYKQHFLGKKSRASGSDSSGDEKKGRGRDNARENFSLNPKISRLKRFIARTLQSKHV